MNGLASIECVIRNASDPHVNFNASLVECSKDLLASVTLKLRLIDLDGTKLRGDLLVTLQPQPPT